MTVRVGSDKLAREPWKRWLFIFAVARLASAISGLSVSYWASNHLGRGDAALFVGWASAASGLVEALIACWAANLLNDSKGPAVYRWLGISAASAALWATFFPQPTSLFALRSFDGLVAGVVSVWALKEVLGPSRELGSGRKLPSWFEGVFLFSFAVGSIVAPILWRQFATFSLAASALVYAALAFMKVESLKPGDSIRHPFRLNSAIPFASLAMSASASMWVSQITLLLTGAKFPGQRFPGGFTPTSTGLIVVAYLVVVSFGLALWGGLMVRWAPVKVVRISSIGALAAPLALLMSNSSFVGNSASSALITLYVICVVVQVGLVPGGMALAATIERGSLAGLSSQFVGASSVGAVLGALIGGHVASRWSFAGLCVASFTLAALATLAMSIDKFSRVEV